MAKALEVHPFAELFPLHDGPPLWELRRDIEEQGQLDPIITYHGKVLDGRRRQVCCIAAGVVPKYKPFKGTEAEALAFVVSKNLRRRHLGEAERAMVAAKIAKLPVGANQHTTGDGEGGASAPPSNSQAAQMMNVSVEAVKRAKTVQEHGSEELKEAVADGTVALSDAAKVAKQPKEKQVKAVAQVKAGEAKTASAAVEREPGDDDDEDATPLLDAAGQPVPAQAALAFERAWQLEVWGRELDALVRRAAELCKGPGTRLIDFEAARIHLRNGKLTILQNRATHVCPLCCGKDAGGKKCQACGGEAWTAEHVHKRITADQQRARA